MHVVGGTVVLSPTDLSGYLTCRHRTALDLAVARGAAQAPTTIDPFAAMLQQLGVEHERRYVESLRARGRQVVDLGVARDVRRVTAAEETLAAMRAGVDVIVQARLEHADLAGYADVLVRVDEPCSHWPWHYEAQDTKLARETKGATILQLSAYSELVGELQGKTPERFYVVTPGSQEPLTAGSESSRGFTVHSYRVEDYRAYYRMVVGSLRDAMRLRHDSLAAAFYPEPVAACAVCRWEARCLGRRYGDDHLSLIAGASRVQRAELSKHGHHTLAAVARMAVPVAFRPSRGSREAYGRIGEQARVQLRQREEGRPVVERLPVVAGEGLCRLPEPSPGDLFLDVERAQFAREGGREFLFGLWDGRRHRSWWAADDESERRAFEELIEIVLDAWSRDDGMHVYHFNHHEVTAIKKLMGRHVTRGDEVDRLLRSGRFIDLSPITRQAVRAGVESYSSKKLELYTGYTRTVPLQHVAHARIVVELALEAGAFATIEDGVRATVAGYNEDDCRSTEALRIWLEALRSTCIAEGLELPRPVPEAGEPSARVSELQADAAAIRARLLDGLAADAGDPSHADHHRWLAGYLVDYHKREENADWWDYFRLLELPEDELLDEKRAIAGLELVGRVQVVTHKTTGRPTGSVVDRYRYPNQEIEIGGAASLRLRNGQHMGTVVARDRHARTLDIKKGEACADVHPTTVFCADVISTSVQQKAVMRLAGHLFDGCGLDLLRRGPRLAADSLRAREGESATDAACRIVQRLGATTLAVQGPPGAGKTYNGAQMIRTLVRQGKRVGVTANSHKVIRNLLDEIRAQAVSHHERLNLGHKIGAGEVADAAGESADVLQFVDNDAPLAGLRSGQIQVLGGTPFLWAREEYAGSVDVLFVDEAGQMSLASALAVSLATTGMVLLGDPQQLDQPQKGTHPDGVGVSALQHMLGAHETMPADRGIFLPTTWRMSPTLCAFTSEQFYERKLQSMPALAAQRLCGTGSLDGSHLWLVPMDHDGNQSASDEEVDAVVRLVDRLLAPRAGWVDARGATHPMTAEDIRVVAPFNAQVNRLSERLAVRGVPVGTVDKFQGQTAAVAIYSMTASRPEDAPRGLEFLYSLNRLNVATSRARCAVFLIASSRLFEPECRTPRQMRLANALCRYRELARVVDLTAPDSARAPVLPRGGSLFLPFSE